MPWTTEHKTQSREKILSSAARMFTNRGFDGVSIDEVMQDAGLTRGAFYAHFESKTDIYRQAVLFGAKKAKEHLSKNGVKNVIELAEDYLNIGTNKTALEYCTLAFLITDMSKREDEIKSTYTQVLKGYQDVLVSLGISKKAAVQVSVILIGGLAISRAVTDKKLKADILQNCLETTRNIVESETAEQ